MKSKADQYVEDYKKFEECKEPAAPIFMVEDLPAATVSAKQGNIIFISSHLRKEHALAFAQWIIDTYSVPAESKPKPDWCTPVVGKVYKTKGGDSVEVIDIHEGNVLVRAEDGSYTLSYDAFPRLYLKASSYFDIIGFWEDDK
jgi:hypothetical protein